MDFLIIRPDESFKGQDNDIYNKKLYPVKIKQLYINKIDV